MPCQSLAPGGLGKTSRRSGRLGQEGFGETVIEIQNRSDNMVPKSITAGAALSRTLGPHGAVRIDTATETTVNAGLYTGTLTGNNA